MPPHLGLYFRAGDEAGQGKIRSRLDRNPDEKGWASSDHLYAMRPDPFQYECTDDDRNNTFRARGDPAAYGFPHADRNDRPDDSRYLRCAGKRFGAERIDRSRFQDSPTVGQVAAFADGAERTS